MSDGKKTVRNCLIVFRNKKINNFEYAEKVISGFSAGGYYFDNIVCVAYDNSADIARSLSDCKSNYDNLVILCPQIMENAVKDYLSGQYNSQFDLSGFLKSDEGSAFVLFSDAQSRLKVGDIVQILNANYGKSFEKSYIRAVGVADINSAIAKAKAKCPEIDFNVYDSFGDCKIELTYDTAIPKAAYDGAYRTLLAEIKDNVYAVEDISLAERLVQLLKLRRMKICVAESFTGGGICKRLVEIPGVSEVFFEGVNTYSNLSKIQRLGVDELTIKAHGAVSKETAYEMAEGLIALGNCDVSIATTGIAGPKSDNTRKPVGLVYIAVGLKQGVSVNKYHISGDRKSVTETAINLALFNAFKLLK